MRQWWERWIRRRWTRERDQTSHTCWWIDDFYTTSRSLCDTAVVDHYSAYFGAQRAADISWIGDAWAAKVLIEITWRGA
jgi:hypothetical protein